MNFKIIQNQCRHMATSHLTELNYCYHHSCIEWDRGGSCNEKDCPLLKEIKEIKGATK